MIRVNHITKTFDGIKSLDDVSLDVGKNEVVAIIGQSGSGKSTLLNCIAGLENVDSGTIEVNSSHSGPYNGVGMVFQQGNLFPHLTVLQNLILAPVKVLGMSKKEAEEEALNLLDKVGMWTKMSAYPETLSIGQRQRVAIARSLMMKPDVLLLDEPTSALDAISATEVLNVLLELKKNNITIVLVTHKLDFVRNMCDRVIFMHNGRIYEQGTPHELINNPHHHQTKLFVNYCFNLVYDIASSKYDYPELVARIDNFCHRYRMHQSESYSTQLVVEELLNLLPLDDGVRLVIAKLDKGLQVEALLPDPDRTYISYDSLDDELSYSIIQGMCQEIEEFVNESSEKVIRLVIKNNL